MATNKDTENSTPSAQTPADNDIAKLTEVTEQDLAEAIIDEYGAKYSKDGKRLLKGPRSASLYNIKKGTEIIGNSAFYGCSTLTAITIPPSVRTMEGNPFYSWRGHIDINSPYFKYEDGALVDVEKGILVAFRSNAKSYTIPPSVNSIGGWAFKGCSSLTSITIPPSVRTMEGNPFENWHGHIDINSPYFKYEDGGLVDVEKGILVAFCSNAESYTIPPSVTTIGDSAFSSCKSLTSITIPPSVNSIGGWAFNGCSSLTSITIPPSVTSIGNSAFSDCSSLASIAIPPSVTAIGDSAFCRCKSLTSITIPPSVTTIGDYAFSGCESLTSIAIPPSVTTIGYSVFRGCESLTSITIPPSVTAIDDSTYS